MEMRHRHRGFTMIELVVYFALSSIVLLTLVGIFKISNRSQQATYSSYLVGGRTYSALSVLRRDLQNTALSAIEAYPQKGSSSEPPGMSCPSPFGFSGDEKGQLQISPHGSPDWQKMVHYTVQKTSGKVGSLLRWSSEFKPDNFLPERAPGLPSAIQGDQGNALLEDVLLANQAVTGVGEGGQYTTGPAGGFEIQFVRREGGEAGEESLSSANPRGEDARGNTRLVQATLRILRDQKSSEPTLYVLKIRACPRY